MQTESMIEERKKKRKKESGKQQLEA